jgi:hypothetical protein
MIIQPFDRQELRRQYIEAEPFPFVKVENFLDPLFATQVASAYPGFDDASRKGRVFKTVHERRKIQITDARLFPKPIAQLNDALASREFLSDLAYVTGIPHLLADEQLVGGGMHITGPGGRLDVHVDFNYIESRKLHRRLNVLLYLNPIWEASWGGHIQLWDRYVKACRQSFAPSLNRCVIFETSDVSFHGVTPITIKAPYPRISFATYYYTREAPPNWNGTVHNTIFRARPEERFRRYVFMPADMLKQRLVGRLRRIKRKVEELTHTD